MARKGKFSLEEATEQAISIMKGLHGVEGSVICGSYRRGLDYVGDLDIVVIPAEDDLETTIASIHSMSTEILASGTKLVRTILPSGMQGDFYIAPRRLVGSFTLFLTGSKGFNIKCRARAKEMGFRLSQYGLIDEHGNEVDVTELGILEKLGLLNQFAAPAARSI